MTSHGQPVASRPTASLTCRACPHRRECNRGRDRRTVQDKFGAQRLVFPTSRISRCPWIATSFRHSFQSTPLRFDHLHGEMKRVRALLGHALGPKQTIFFNISVFFVLGVPTVARDGPSTSLAFFAVRSVRLFARHIV